MNGGKRLWLSTRKVIIVLNEYTVRAMSQFSGFGDEPPPFIEIPSLMDILAKYPMSIVHLYPDSPDVYLIEFRIGDYRWTEYARGYLGDTIAEKREKMLDHGIRRCFLEYEAMKREQAFYESIRH